MDALRWWHPKITRMTIINSSHIECTINFYYINILLFIFLFHAWILFIAIPFLPCGPSISFYLLLSCLMYVCTYIYLYMHGLSLTNLLYCYDLYGLSSTKQVFLSQWNVLSQIIVSFSIQTLLFSLSPALLFLSSWILQLIPIYAPNREVGPNEPGLIQLPVLIASFICCFFILLTQTI